MALPLWALMAAAGAAKSEVIDRPEADRQRKINAEIVRYSPWTKMQAQPIKEADTLGSAMQFGMAGAGMQQGMDQAAGQQKMQDAYLANMQADTASKQGWYNQPMSGNFSGNFGPQQPMRR